MYLTFQKTFQKPVEIGRQEARAIRPRFKSAAKGALPVNLVHSIAWLSCAPCPAAGRRSPVRSQTSAVRPLFPRGRAWLILLLFGLPATYDFEVLGGGLRSAWGVLAWCLTGAVTGLCADLAFRFLCSSSPPLKSGGSRHQITSVKSILTETPIGGKVKGRWFLLRPGCPARGRQDIAASLHIIPLPAASRGAISFVELHGP